MQERPTSDPDQSVYGMEINVNTHDKTDQTRDYRWEWMETWEIVTPITSSFYPDEARCWQSAGSGIISIGTSEHLTHDIIADYPIYFVSTESNKLRIKYSLLVNQYSLSREAIPIGKIFRTSHRIQEHSLIPHLPWLPGIYLTQQILIYRSWEFFRLQHLPEKEFSSTVQKFQNPWIYPPAIPRAAFTMWWIPWK